jgi:hypothetical protein
MPTPPKMAITPNSTLSISRIFIPDGFSSDSLWAKSASTYIEEISVTTI